MATKATVEAVTALLGTAQRAGMKDGRETGWVGGADAIRRQERDAAAFSPATSRRQGTVTPSQVEGYDPAYAMLRAARCVSGIRTSTRRQGAIQRAAAHVLNQGVIYGPYNMGGDVIAATRATRV